ncbi:hypothetical protein N9I00_00640 [bacterium]|nr:hypothetical protein [bacterium]
MGRSVSTPRDAIVAYYDVSEHGYGWDEENNCVDFDNFDEYLVGDDWDHFKEWMVEKVKELFPSMSECEEWVDREELAIAENQLAYFGVSEYCGCAAVWIVAKKGYYGDDVSPLAEAWVSKIAKKFHANFGEMEQIGVFSNGEAVYEKKSA